MSATSTSTSNSTSTAFTASNSVSTSALTLKGKDADATGGDTDTSTDTGTTTTTSGGDRSGRMLCFHALQTMRGVPYRDNECKQYVDRGCTHQVRSGLLYFLYFLYFFSTTTRERRLQGMAMRMIFFDVCLSSCVLMC